MSMSSLCMQLIVILSAALEHLIVVRLLYQNKWTDFPSEERGEII